MKTRRRRFQSPKVRLEAGSYKIRFYDLEKKRRTKSLGRAGEITLAEAKRAAQEFLRPINDQRESARHTGRTVGDAVRKWRASIKPLLRPATARNYEVMFKKLEPLHGCPCSILGKADVQEWVTGLAANHKPSTVHMLKGFASGFFSVVEDWGWIERNPARERIRLPPLEPSEKRVLMPDQVCALLEVLDLESKTLVMLAFLSGLRRGEISALEWGDIDGEGIHVRRSGSRENVTGPPKSPKSKGLVRIGPMLRAALAEWKAAADPSPLVFPFKGRGHRRNGYHRIYTILKYRIWPACDALGLPRINLHSMRHAFNTWGRLAGIEPEVMRDQMRHSDIRVTLGTYSHLRPTDGAAERIEALLAVPANGTRNPQVVH